MLSDVALKSTAIITKWIKEKRGSFLLKINYRTKSYSKLKKKLQMKIFKHCFHVMKEKEIKNFQLTF